MKSDAELLLAARSDAGAFRELYERYAAAVYGYHLRRTRDPEAALDLTAETFAQAWVSRGRYRDEADGTAAPWLYAIARNVLVLSVRRGRLEGAARERIGLLRPAASAEPDATWLDGVDEALAGLPHGQQRALRLRFVDDLAYEQVAETLGITPQAARVRVHRGLAALRSRLNERRETP